MSPNPVTGAAAWTLALVVDVVAAVVAVAVLAWGRWCSAGSAGCPSGLDRPGREALVVGVLGAVLLVVALVALLTGRLLLAVVQVTAVVLLLLAVRQGMPAAWTHLRAHQFQPAGISQGMPRA